MSNDSDFSWGVYLAIVAVLGGLEWVFYPVWHASFAYAFFDTIGEWLASLHILPTALVPLLARFPCYTLVYYITIGTMRHPLEAALKHAPPQERARAVAQAAYMPDRDPTPSLWTTRVWTERLQRLRQHQALQNEALDNEITLARKRNERDWRQRNS